MEIKELIKQLTSANGVSGHENEAANVALNLIKDYVDTVEIDHMGNMIACKYANKEDAKTIVLDAHIDQIGFMVTEVLDGGFLRFTQVGGVDPRMLLGIDVKIVSDDKEYFGVISCMPPHLLQGVDASKSIMIDEMLIDTGFDNAKDKIKIGDIVVFNEEIYNIDSSSVTGKCLDDRAGVACLIDVAQRLKDTKLPFNIVFLASTNEEQGMTGAMTAAFRLGAEYGIAVDVSHAYTPDAPRNRTYEFGGGAMVGMGPNLNKKVTQKLIKTAKAEDIPYQIEVSSGRTGTNAWVMQIAGSGVAMGLISIPLRYMHTPIETIKYCDVQAVTDLLYEFLVSGDEIC